MQNNDTGNAEDAFTYAESREEEAARLQKEQEEQKAQAAGNGQAIVDYACQFIGIRMYGEVRASQTERIVPDSYSQYLHILESHFRVRHGIWRMRERR